MLVICNIELLFTAESRIYCAITAIILKNCRDGSATIRSLWTVNSNNMYRFNNQVFCNNV